MKEKRNGLIVLFIILFLFWMILASVFNISEVILGLLTAFMILLYSVDLVFTKKEASSITFKTTKWFFILVVRLIKEMIIANIHVAKIVLSPSLPVDPGFVTIKQPLKKPLNQALFGNAITLTPGTLTVDMTSEEVVVHGLKKSYVHDILDSGFKKAFEALEGVSRD
ncbi:MAG: Na+/H+ antiporter subunit E [Candidatus Izemoplasmataceae bacterium]